MAVIGCPLNLSASRLACSTPRSSSGGSAMPWTRPAAFQVERPCRINNNITLIDEPVQPVEVDQPPYRDRSHASALDQLPDRSCWDRSRLIIDLTGFHARSSLTRS